MNLKKKKEFMNLNWFAFETTGLSFYCFFSSSFVNVKAPVQLNVFFFTCFFRLFKFDFADVLLMTPPYLLKMLTCFYLSTFTQMCNCACCSNELLVFSS